MLSFGSPTFAQTTLPPSQAWAPPAQASPTFTQASSALTYPGAGVAQAPLPALSQPSEAGVTALIPGQLYLADKAAAASLALVKSHGITHAVNAANDTPNHHPNGLVYYNPRLGDPMTEQLDIEGPLGFIESALSQGGRVMIFCNVGVSRGPTIAAAHLMKSQGVSSSEALRQVQGSRPGVNPIPNHQQALAQFESRLRGQTSAVIPQQAFTTELPQTYLPSFTPPSFAPPGYTQIYQGGSIPQAFPMGYVQASFVPTYTTGFPQSFMAPYPPLFTTGYLASQRRFKSKRRFSFF